MKVSKKEQAGGSGDQLGLSIHYILQTLETKGGGRRSGVNRKEGS